MSLLKAQEPSALEIAAEQMRLWPNMDPGQPKYQYYIYQVIDFYK